MKTSGRTKHGSRAGQLKDDDHEVWEQVTRTVKPLNRLPYVKPAAEIRPARPVSDHERNVKSVPRPADPVRKAARAIVRHAIQPQPHNNLDRRHKQKLSRGNVDIEARLDLHGHSVERARMSLLGFLQSSREQGFRNVLVITGKGASPFTRHTLHSTDVFQAPERQGRLRAEFPRWMAQREFSSSIVGFQPAHPRHGGGGAFYVRLKRKADRP
ncbi:MAG: DNA mismatch repair protein MutS [Anderseniella sp.]|jgi:DNA-nicking Smr family endonuclease|nr:DNA mismatch repair protein MutS [Anderseniella sp.]